MSESATKLGGAQAAFRSPMSARSFVWTTPQLLERFVSWRSTSRRMEEMSLLTVTKTNAVSAQPAMGAAQQANTSLKVMAASYGHGDGEEKSGTKPVCKFWKSDDGCKKGTSCTYIHETADMKGPGFGCGGLHMKKGTKPNYKKVSKVKTAKAGEKLEAGETVTKEAAEGDEPSAGSGSSPTSASVRSVDSPEKTASKDATAELLTEATSLLKTLRSMKVLRVKELRQQEGNGSGAVGLLDGGATNGLRRAHPHEVSQMFPVRVELASGSTTLFRVEHHKTLLTHDHVEVIVPLHRLVTLGYKLQWTAAGVKITHPEHARIQCTMRAGCPVLPEGEALALLDIMEKEDRGELFMDESIKAWWIISMRACALGTGISAVDT